MESKIVEMQKTIDTLLQANTELSVWKQEYNSQKQSFIRMSSRLRKLCKKLDPSQENVVEMQQLANEIRDLVKQATK